jgi:hypothetical protein
VKRRLLNLLTVLSLGLCLLFAAETVHRFLQPASDHNRLTFHWQPVARTEVAMSFGGLCLSHDTDAPRSGRIPDEPAYPLIWASWRFPGLWFYCERLAYFETEKKFDWGPVLHWMLVIPTWACTLVTALLPSLWMARSARRGWNGRRKPRVCSNCGYDLRATPGRCPECGRVPPTQPNR